MKFDASTDIACHVTSSPAARVLATRSVSAHMCANFLQTWLGGSSSARARCRGSRRWRRRPHRPDARAAWPPCLGLGTGLGLKVSGLAARRARGVVAAAAASAAAACSTGVRPNAAWSGAAWRALLMGVALPLCVRPGCPPVTFAAIMPSMNFVKTEDMPGHCEVDP